MHPLYAKADALSGEVIGAAIEVHRDKGPGLLESISERCLRHERLRRRHSAVNQKIVRITYKDLTFDEPFRFDVPVEDCLLVGAKSVGKICRSARPSF